MATARSRRQLIVPLGLAMLATATFALAAYGALHPVTGPEIIIDFSESIDSRLVYPMDRETVIKSTPELVELRFPGGRTYWNDKAWEVWVTRNPLGPEPEPHLMEEVSVNTRHETPDSAYVQANQLRQEWGFPPDPVFEQWYEDRKRTGPGDWSLDKAGRSQTIAGTERNGKILSVGFEIRGAREFSPPYQLIETFYWTEPTPEDGAG
jgi:hypothetical protein